LAGIIGLLIENLLILAWGLELLMRSEFPERHEKDLELLPLTRQIARWFIVER
jgi:hypothetical protein